MTTFTTLSLVNDVHNKIRRDIRGLNCTVSIRLYYMQLFTDDETTGDDD